LKARWYLFNPISLLDVLFHLFSLFSSPACGRDKESLFRGRGRERVKEIERGRLGERDSERETEREAENSNILPISPGTDRSQKGRKRRDRIIVRKRWKPY